MTAQMHDSAARYDHDEVAMHPVHGEMTCVEVEASGRRAWEKVTTLSEKITSQNEELATVREMLVATRRDLADAVAERTALRDQVDKLTGEWAIDDDTITDLEARVADLEALLAYVPDLATLVDRAYRTASGKTSGPLPVRWKEHLSSPEATARVQAVLAEALASARVQERLAEAMEAEYTHYNGA